MSENTLEYSVLFIEDEVAIRENYVRFLKTKYKEVYEAEDGEEAYKIYKEKKPQILIVDINIPKLNGIELLKRIRKTDQTTRVIILTAHADVHYLLSATELNLTKYLLKPVSRGDLKSALALAVESLKTFSVTSNKLIHLKENYLWNHETGELLCKDMIVSLTKTEKKLFTLLVSRIDYVFSYDEIIENLWGDYGDFSKVDSLKTLIKNLRKKLPKESVENVFGIGYKLCY